MSRTPPERDWIERTCDRLTAGQRIRVNVGEVTVTKVEDTAAPKRGDGSRWVKVSWRDPDPSVDRTGFFKRKAVNPVRVVIGQ